MRTALFLLGASLVIGGCASTDKDVADTKMPAGTGQPLYKPGQVPADVQARSQAQVAGAQQAANSTAKQMQEMAAARQRANGGK